MIRRLQDHLREHVVDVACAVVGVAGLAGPLVIAVPAASVAIAAALVLILRNPGGEQ